MNNSRQYDFKAGNRSKWKRYIYSLIGAEISAVTRFCDYFIQVNPLAHDTGLLFEHIQCKNKQVENCIERMEDCSENSKDRSALLLNGNFCYGADVEKDLKQLRAKLSRHGRLFVVLYNPFMKLLYRAVKWLGLRDAPLPDAFITNTDLQNIAKLAGYEIVRIRPCVFLPVPIPIVANLLNKVLPIIPLIRRMALVWVVILRAVASEKERPSLSIIVPARNEAGNILECVDRLPRFEGAKIEVIFVEGHSQDNTWERIQDLVDRANSPFPIKAFQQSGRGKYDAVRLGFEKSSHELVTILDADLTMPPEDLPRFYEAYCMGLGDFINGNRLLYQMEEAAMRPLNRLGNMFFAKVLSWVLGLQIGDSLCGTKMFALRDYERIEAWREAFGDFDPFGDFEMLFAASELALGTQDVPIRYRARTYGKTQISRFSDGLKLMRMTLVGFGGILLGKTK